MHGFSFHENGMQNRYMEYKKNIHDGTEFTNSGMMQPFENREYYKAKRTKDRMTRAIICEYLAKLDIDALSVFERRELDNPYLYTADHEGQSCSIYEEDRLRYRKWCDEI